MSDTAYKIEITENPGSEYPRNRFMATATRPGESFAAYCGFGQTADEASRRAQAWVDADSQRAESYSYEYEPNAPLRSVS